MNGYSFLKYPLKEADMFAVGLLEQAATGHASIWVPVIVLGWFLLMTLVGWQVSRHTAAADLSPVDTSPESNPSEFDTH